MTTPLTVVIAHGKANAVFRRHLPLWEAHGTELLVCCPKDDPVDTTHKVLPVGVSQGAGECAHARLATLLFHLATLPHSHFAIFEYDSFLTQRQLPLCSGFRAIVFKDMECPKFIATRYPGFPWIVAKEALQALVDVAKRYPDITERGHNDRWVGALVQLANVPLVHFEPPGFSRGDIDEFQFDDFKIAIERGVYAFHGVKRPWAFQFVAEKLCPAFL